MAQVHFGSQALQNSALEITIWGPVYLLEAGPGRKNWNLACERSGLFINEHATNSASLLLLIGWLNDTSHVSRSPAWTALQLRPIPVLQPVFHFRDASYDDLEVTRSHSRPPPHGEGPSRVIDTYMGHQAGQRAALTCRLHATHPVRRCHRTCSGVFL